MPTLCITGGRVIDPASRRDEPADVVLTDGRVAAVAPGAADAVDAAEVIDARGLVVAPGFVDLHVHFREPGHEYKETIGSGSRAAAAGGFTTVCQMANTDPPIDSAGLVDAALLTAASARIRVLPTATITQGRAGAQLAPLAELADAGVVAFSDDGDFVADAAVMRRALEYAAAFGLPLADHCEDPALIAGGQMHEGWVSARLGLAGRPAAAEVAAVARDIALAEETGVGIHLQHISTARAIALIADARGRGVPLTAEVTPHHLTLTHEAVAFGVGGDPDADLRYDTNAKCNPPLREPDDVAACIDGLRTGVIDCIATDHAPHASHEKDAEFDAAPPGLIGLETAFAVCMRLVHDGALSLPALIDRLTAGPVRAWRLDARPGLAGLGSLAPGAPADCVLLDPDAAWTVDPAPIASQSHNTPWLGHALRGRVVATVYGGALVYDARAAARPDGAAR